MKKHTTLTKSKWDKDVKCPKCGKVVRLRGLGGHLFIVHQIRNNKQYQIDQLTRQIHELLPYKEKCRKLEIERENWHKTLLDLKCVVCGKTLNDIKDSFMPIMAVEYLNGEIMPHCELCKVSKGIKSK